MNLSVDHRVTIGGPTTLDIGIGQTMSTDQCGRVDARLEPAHDDAVVGTAGSHQSCSVLNVSQSWTRPDFSPVMNQRVRCSDEPWVKASGTT